MKKVLLVAAVSACFSNLVTAADADDNYSKVQFVERTQYRTASDQFLQMFRIAGSIKDKESMVRGMYWSIETNSSMGDDVSEFKSSYQEAEFNKGFYFGKNRVAPGMVFSWNSSGLRVDPYLEFGRKITDDFSLALRTRYNINTYDSKDVNGDMDRDRTQRYDLYLNYSLTDDLTAKLNSTYYIKDNDYVNRNGKDTLLENNVTFQYDDGSRFKPFIELGHLGKNVKKDNDVEYQVRVGFRYQLAN